MKSIEKLRAAGRNMAKGRNLEKHEECNLLLVIADAIEAEIAERYMELPVDADGVPIRIGEVVTWLNGAPSNKFTIDTFAFDMDHGEWDVKSSNFLNIFPAHRCRHVKPRTVEDVLREFAQCFCTDKINFDGSADGDTVAKYAAEIRELMGVDDGHRG